MKGVSIKLSPITKRRWSNFKANKRGYLSLWIFVALLLITLPAEFIANDKPVLVSYNNSFYFPVLKDYPEIEFGGFLAITDFRDPWVQQQIANNNGWMIWPLLRYSYQTINWNPPTPAPSPPSLENPLGTDSQSRDVLARVIYGFRLSVMFGLLLTVFSSIIGIAAGALQGYFGGWVDLLTQRFQEIWSGLPSLYLLIILASFMQPSFALLLGLLLAFSWMSLTGLVRAEFLRARNFDYVRSARALGVSNLSIIRRHILPNAMVASLTMMPFILNGGITALTSLDFLGFGLPPGSPSLGELLAQGKANLNAPWLGITGVSVLIIMLSLLIFIGEATRDAFDPRKQ